MNKKKVYSKKNYNKPKITRKAFNEMLLKSGKSISDVSKYLKITKRTIERWCSGKQCIPRNESLYLKILTLLDYKKAKAIEPVMIFNNRKLAFGRRHSGMTTKENVPVFKDIDFSEK